MSVPSRPLAIAAVALWGLGCSDLRFATSDGEAPDAGAPAANVVFVTSEAVSFSETGTAEADALCNRLAARAGISGTFSAWYGRGRSGFQALVGSRGWVRMDGLPVADRLGDLIEGRMRRPVAFDESGNDVGDHALVLTSTSAGGDAAPTGVCQLRNSVTAGQSHATGGWAFAGAQVACSEPARLYCFGYGRQVALEKPAASSGAFRAFLSRGTFRPGAGIAEADDLCSSEARAAGYSGDFTAFLSTGASSAIERIGSDGGPWVRSDGVAIGGLAELGANRWTAPLNVTVAGEYIDDYVWLGAAPMGGDGDGNCSSWLDDSPGARGGGGRNGFTRNLFEDVYSSCSQAHPIMCFQRAE